MVPRVGEGDPSFRSTPYSSEGPGREWNPYQWAPPTTELLIASSPSQGPTMSPFTTCKASGIYYYTDPPRVHSH